MISKTLKTAAIVSSLGRAGLGGAFLADPARFGQLWIGRRARHDGVGILTRAVGARDIALGAGTAGALVAGENGTARGWLLAQAACDSADFAATFVAADRIPDRSARLTLQLAGGSAILSVLTALALKDKPEARKAQGGADASTVAPVSSPADRAGYSPGPRENQGVDEEKLSEGTEKLGSIAGN